MEDKLLEAKAAKEFRGRYRVEKSNSYSVTMQEVVKPDAKHDPKVLIVMASYFLDM